MTDGDLTFCSNCGAAYDGAHHDCPVCDVLARVQRLNERLNDVEDTVDHLADAVPRGDA